MRQLQKLLVTVCGVALLAGVCRAQATADARRARIEAELRGPAKEQVDKAFTDMRLWLRENQADGENAFWRVRVSLLAHPEHAAEMMEMIELGKEGKKTNRYGIGYLYALQAICLCQLDQTEAGAAVVRAGLKIDEAGTAGEVLTGAMRPLAAAHKEKQAAELLQQVAIGCGDDLALVEAALQQRCELLEASGQHAAALACAHSLFNACAVQRGATAANVLAGLLGRDPADTARVSPLRTEQTNGARPVAQGAAGVTSPVMLGIAIDPAPYAETLATMNDDTYANASRHAALLLVAGKGDDALAAAKTALDKAAGTAANVRTANDLIARCYKAQDGTTRRAMAYLASSGAMTAARGLPTATPAGPVDPGMP